MLLLTPSATNLNLTAGEIAPLAFILQNLGEEEAVNVTLSLVAHGCAQLLGWNSTWESSLTVNMGNLTPGSAKRVLVPVRCRGGSGSIAATAYGDNADPTYAIVKVSAAERSEPWLFAPIPLAAAAALVSIYALRRARRRGPRSSKREKAPRKRSKRNR